MTDLTAKYVRELLSYDSETGLFTWNKRIDKPGSGGKTWNIKFSGKRAGSINKHGYYHLSINNKSYLAHRLAWLYMYGEWPKNQIDHINSIRTDNRIINLRCATQSQNSQNLKHALPNNKTGFLGVCWVMRDKKFVATIKINKKKKWLGYFETAEEAHEAYLTEKRKLHSYCTI